MRCEITQLAGIKIGLANQLPSGNRHTIQRQRTGRRQRVDAYAGKLVGRRGGIHIGKTKVCGMHHQRRVFGGNNRVIGTGRFVIASVDRDRQGGVSGAALPVADLIRNRLDQRVVRRQGLHRRIIHIQHIAIRTIRRQRDGAVCHRSGNTHIAGTAVDFDHRERIRFNIGIGLIGEHTTVVCADQHIADGVTDSIDHKMGIGAGNRKIIRAIDGNRQLRCIGQPTRILNRIGKDFVETLACAQCFDGRVRFSHNIGVAAVGIQRQAAIGPG